MSEVGKIAQALQKAGIPCEVVDTGGAVLNAHVVGDSAWIAVSEDGVSVFYGDPETDDGSQVGVQGLEIDVASWRVIATKSFLIFDLSAGYGSDNITTGGQVRASAPGSGLTETVGLNNDVTRTVIFAGLTLSLGPIALAGEIGQATGGSLATFNRFDAEVNAARGFASVGLRFGF